jgi:hypothetical protein
MRSRKTELRSSCGARCAPWHRNGGSSGGDDRNGPTHRAQRLATPRLRPLCPGRPAPRGPLGRTPEPSSGRCRAPRHAHRGSAPSETRCVPAGDSSHGSPRALAPSPPSATRLRASLTACRPRIRALWMSSALIQRGREPRRQTLAPATSPRSRVGHPGKFPGGRRPWRSEGVPHPCTYLTVHVPGCHTGSLQLFGGSGGMSAGVPWHGGAWATGGRVPPCLLVDYAAGLGRTVAKQIRLMDRCQRSPWRYGFTGRLLSPSGTGGWQQRPRSQSVESVH